MATRSFDTVIVGAGHAGAQAAVALVQQKYSGSFALLSNEHEFPYERPPLSKEYLSGEKEFDRILIRPANFWSDRSIPVLFGQEVTHVDPVAKSVRTKTGDSYGFRHLIWATGGAPRKLACEGFDLAGVHYVRARKDVDQMMTELGSVQKVAVIGGGFIGLEAAAVLRKLGKPVTLFESQDRLLARVAGVAISTFYASEHVSHGVSLRLSASVDGLEGVDGKVTGVRLADGEVIAADMVIVGIGIVPAIGPLADAGAEVGNGVHVDQFCRTNLKDIYAIGDCAAHENRFADGARIRLESVQNASDQAVIAVRSILDQPTPYEAVPWFWSNQYDLRMQTVGLSIGFDEEIVRGDPSTRSYSVIYRKGGRVIAIDCINATKDYVQGKALVEKGVRAERLKLADPSKPLKEIAAAEAQ